MVAELPPVLITSSHTSPTYCPRQQPQSPRPNRILNPSNSPRHSPTVLPRQQTNWTITLQTNDPPPKFNLNHGKDTNPAPHCRQTRKSGSRRSSDVRCKQLSPTYPPITAKRPRTAAPTSTMIMNFQRTSRR